MSVGVNRRLSARAQLVLNMLRHDLSPIPDYYGWQTIEDIDRELKNLRSASGREDYALERMPNIGPKTIRDLLDARLIEEVKKSVGYFRLCAPPNEDFGDLWVE